MYVCASYFHETGKKEKQRVVGDTVFPLSQLPGTGFDWIFGKEAEKRPQVSHGNSKHAHLGPETQRMSTSACVF